MTKKTKILIAVGGTGGHVFPGCNLAVHLAEQDFDVKLITDKRGEKYFKDFYKLNYSVLPSSPLVNKNILSITFSSILIVYSVLRSFFYLILNRPSIIFGMGGYASFPICIVAYFLKVKFIIYENNLIIGKANRYLLPFSKKIFVAYKELEGVPKNYQYKIFETGNIIKKEIINLSQLNPELKETEKISILVLGGSQAAKVFAEKLPNIFQKCSNNGILLKIFQQCLPSQNEKLKSFYEKAGIEFEIFNFSNNITEYFSKTNLAITRSGSSMLAELTNARIPFITVPLPSSADNHQLKNALFYQKKNFSLLVEEKYMDEKMFKIIKDIYENKSKIVNILENQRQYSDKKVYNNINKVLKDLTDEKN